MKANRNRWVAAFAFAAPLSSLAQLPAVPLPWRLAVEAAATGDPKFPVPNIYSKPLEYRAKLWDVPFVVYGRDHVSGTFCRGSMVAPGWVLTAASCVCGENQLTDKQIELIVERETGTAEAKRIQVLSTIENNRIWLFQNSESAIPKACVDDASKLLPGVFPTIGKDLALVRVTLSDLSPGEKRPEQSELEMLGTTKAPPAILSDIVAARFDSSPQSSRDVAVESVFIGQRTAITPDNREYSMAGEFVLERAATVETSSCLFSNHTSLATISSNPGAGTATFRLCADLELAGRKAASIRGGTGVAMSDHRRPLLLGVVGRDGAYTSLLDPVQGTSVSIAQSAETFIAEATNAEKAKRAISATTNWVPLHRPAPDSTGTCQTVYYATMGDVDIFLYRPTQHKKPAYVFRQKDVWIDVRGAPNSYRENDPPVPHTVVTQQNQPAKAADRSSRNAKSSRKEKPPEPLDKLVNAGYPDGDWAKVLVKKSPAAEKPFKQESGRYKDFFISMTRFQNDRVKPTVLTRYVNADNVPYVVFNEDWVLGKGIVGDAVSSDDWAQITGRLGDLAFTVALEPDAQGKLKLTNQTPALIADVDRKRFGGISQFLARSLDSLKNRTLSAADGINPRMEVMFMVFPDSGERKYNGEKLENFRRDAQVRLNQFGGWPDPACLTKP